MRRLLVVFVSSLLLALSGCGGLVALDVESTPAGAKVYVQDDYVGTTPTGVVTCGTPGPFLPVTLEKLNHKPVKVILSVREWPNEEEARKHVYKLNMRLKRR